MNMTIEQITAAYPNVAKLESQAGRELLTAVMGQLSALAAENTGLKDYLKPCGLSIEGTPATDAILAEVRASAIRTALDDCTEHLDRDCIMESNGISYEDAALREEGALALRNALLGQGAALSIMSFAALEAAINSVTNEWSVRGPYHEDGYKYHALLRDEWVGDGFESPLKAMRAIHEKLQLERAA